MKIQLNQKVEGQQLSPLKQGIFLGFFFELTLINTKEHSKNEKQKELQVDECKEESFPYYMVRQKQMFQHQGQNKIQIAQNQYDFSVLNEAFKIKRIGINSLSEQRKQRTFKQQVTQKKNLEMRKCKSKEQTEIRQKNQKQLHPRILKFEQNNKQEFEKQDQFPEKQQENYLKSKRKTGVQCTSNQIQNENAKESNQQSLVEDEKQKLLEAGCNPTKMIIKKKAKLVSQNSMKKGTKAGVEMIQIDDISNKKIEWYYRFRISSLLKNIGNQYYFIEDYNQMKTDQGQASKMIKLTTNQVLCRNNFKELNQQPLKRLLQG